MNTEIRTDFTVLGDYEPEILPNIEGSYIRHKGEPVIKGTNRVFESNLWVISTDMIYTLSAAGELKKLINKIIPYKEKFRKIIEYYDLEAEFAISIYTDVIDNVDIEFDSDILNMINYFNSSLDINLRY